MNRIILFFIVLLSVFACNKDVKVVNNSNVENQDWYKNLAKPCSGSCNAQIYKGVYNNSTVYYSILIGATCDPVLSVDLLNFNGEIVKSYSITEHGNFLREVTNSELIYKCN